MIGELLNKLNDRERKMVILLVVFFGCLGIYYVVDSVTSLKGEKVATLEKLRSDIASIRKLATDYKNIVEVGTTKSQLKGDKVLPMMEQMINKHSLKEYQKKLSDKTNPVEGNYIKTIVTIRLNDVPFPNLKNFIYDIEVESPYFWRIEKFNLYKKNPQKPGVFDCRMSIASYELKKG